jgi:Immunity protein 8
MVNGEIKRILTTDGDVLENQHFSSPFYVNLRLEIGIRGLEGADLFDIWICSLSWLDQQPLPLSGQFLIMVKQFDANSLGDFLRHKVASTSGKTTIEVFEKLSRFAYWEYADMANRPKHWDEIDAHPKE